MSQSSPLKDITPRTARAYLARQGDTKASKMTDEEVVKRALDSGIHDFLGSLKKVTEPPKEVKAEVKKDQTTEDKTSSNVHSLNKKRASSANRDVEPAPTPTTQEDNNTAENAKKEVLSQITDLLNDVMATPAQPNIDDDHIIQLIHEHSKTRTVEVKNVAANAPREREKVDTPHKQFDTVMDLLDLYPITRKAPYLVGPSGSGKTTLCMQIAKALGLEFYSTGAVSDPFLLTGFMDGKGDFQPSALYHAFKEGGIYLLDEKDASHPDALVVFNQLLANGCYMFPNGEMVQAHDDFLPISAGNTLGLGGDDQYTARNALDASTLNRDVVVEVDYDEEVESVMAKEAALAVNPHTGTKKIDVWIIEARATRERLRDIDANVVFSPRDTMLGATLLAKGWPKKKMVETVVMPFLTKDQKATLKHIFDYEH